MCSIKKIAALLPILLAPVIGFGQSQEWGVFLGGSYYNGEINPSRQVTPSKPAFGILWDVHMNDRYTFRTIGTYGELQADDNMHDIGLNNFRDLQFETNVLDLSGQLHFNFLPFGNTINVKPYTPYIFIGLSIFNVEPSVSSLNTDTITTATPKESYSRNVTSVAVPFGAGFKAIFGTWTVGLEWNFRKTFTDEIDGIDNQYDFGNTNNEPAQLNQPVGFQKGHIHTNDWYSFIGFTISYRPQPKKNACPGM
jgi:hypothetical protein